MRWQREEVTAAAVVPVAKPCGSVGPYFRKAPQVVLQSQSVRPGPHCFVCGSLGHLHWDCPVKCYECGEAGHLHKVCPRLALNKSGGLRLGLWSPKFECMHLLWR